MNAVAKRTYGFTLKGDESFTLKFDNPFHGELIITVYRDGTTPLIRVEVDGQELL